MNPTNNGTPLLQVSHLYKAYGKHEVIQDLSFEVKPGEVYGFLGRNGVGKSTTIDCIIGAKTFSKGTIVVNGYDSKKEALKAKKSIGYVASEPDCYDEMTGIEYLDFIASIFQVDEHDFEKNVSFLSNRLDLGKDALEKPTSTYSHGMKQKLCLIASLLHAPKVWILDEPTVGLDVMAVEEVTRMMREYADSGHAVLLTSHDISLVSEVCDKAALLNQGKIARFLDFHENPDDRYRLKLIFLSLYQNEERKA